MKQHYTKITNASIESAGLVKDPYQAIAEYFWNGFDAKASRLTLRYDHNELGYISKIEISDNGEGIPFSSLDDSFGNFLDSMKRNVPKRTSYTRGRKGKGRFSFSLLATHASWTTRFLDDDAQIKQFGIKIDRQSKDAFESSQPVKTDQPTGTTVLLEGIFGLSSAELESQEFLTFLAREFGWYLFLNQQQNFQIYINDSPLDYQQIIDETDQVKWTIAASDDQQYVFQINYLRWKMNIGDRYYYYFLNREKNEVAKVLSSFNNNAIAFHHSVYVQSDFFDDFFATDMSLSQEDNLFSERDQQQVYRKLHAELRDFLFRKQKKYILEKAVDDKLQHLLDRGLLPVYENSPVDQLR
ncbi:MAG: ATP-binding protein, partial [Sphingobacterium sp.]